VTFIRRPADIRDPRRLDTCLISRELLREQMPAARCRYCTALSKARHGF
jgi:hypothetical protein